MNRSQRTILFVVLGLSLLPTFAVAVRAQTPIDTTPARAASPAASTVPQNIEEVDLPTVYLRDKDGRLVLLIGGFSYEEYLELNRMHRKLESPQPQRRFSLLSMNIRGPVKDGSAQLKATFRIKLLLEGWARVPLRLNNTYLVKEALYRGEGEHFVDYTEDGDGYACWIRGAADSVHTVELDLLADVEQLGGESRLQLQTPKVTTARLDLNVPGLEVEVAQIEGGDVQTVKRQGASTLLQMIGLSGEFRLTWRDRRRPSAPLVTEARTHIRVEFDGKHHTRSDARILVHALNGAVESFVVRLPGGMKLVPHEEELGQRRYRATTLSEERRVALGLPEPTPRDGDLVEVQLQRKSAEPVEVALRAVKLREAPSSPDAQPTLVEASGFEVLGAAHQWGHIDVALDSEWNAHWIAQHVVRQDNIPADVRQSGVAARFAFSQQPCSLKVRITPKETRVRVEPIHLLYVSAREVRLESRLLYRIRGASDLSIDLTGWQVDAVTPENLIQATQTDFENTSPLTVVLSPLTQEAKDELELRVLARQTLPAEGPFSVRLPQLQATASAPATVVVLPDDNVKLTALPELAVGLDQEPLPPQLDLPQRMQTPLYFRVSNSEQQAIFAGQIELRKRAVSLSSSTQLELASDQTRVEQRFQYKIAHEPLLRAGFWAPRSVLQSGTLKFLLDDQPLTWQAVEPTPLPADGSTDPTLPALEPAAIPEGALDDYEQIVIDLPGGRIRECVIEAQYTLRTPPDEGQNSVDFLAPLLLPASQSETTVSDWRFLAHAEEHIKLDLAPSPWRAAVDDTHGSSTIGGRCEAPCSTLPLRLTYALREAGALVVDKAWLQTWLSLRDRRDRAVFRFRSTEETVRVVLPQAADAESVIVAVDGDRARYLIENDGRTLSIQLPPRPEVYDRVLELWYGFQGRPLVNGLLKINCPRIDDSRRVDRFYWQLCLPEGEHLLVSPAGLTAELAWRWRGFHWGRSSNLSQRDLEDWINASHQADLPSSSNQYLFSSFDAVQSTSIYTMHRRWALLIASLLSLGVGLAMVYAPFLRHPAALLAAAVLLGLGAFFYPDTALLASQAGSIGLALAATAYLIDWGVAGRRVVRPLTHSAVAPAPPDPRSGATLIRPDSDSQGGAPSTPEYAPPGDES
ncbi:hypothetical protein [Lignipirellula cremea]|uniref:Uncharacterized protein n=1 Tax=Lignipirellula cremea TaxID=2528010 RepID=A0A518E576_9BACT|nr:hypothetical protein [Lignipirellula cremea]QDU99231.1 hypothetical protein Pla8534_71440 [Lignipirellula cremea]